MLMSPRMAECEDAEEDVKQWRLIRTLVSDHNRGESGIKDQHGNCVCLFSCFFNSNSKILTVLK